MPKKKRTTIPIIGSLFLFLIIILNIFELFHFLSLDMIFISKLISIILFCFLFYRISLSYILFGNKFKAIDFFILIGYLFFSIKSILGIITSYLLKISAGDFFYEIFLFIFRNQFVIEYYGFVLGAIIITLSSAYFCFVKIGKNSLMYLIHESKRLRGKDIFIRFFVSLIVLLSFYIIVFNLALEWLVLIIHGPLLVILFLLYLIIALNKHHLKPKKFLHKVIHSAEMIYERLIRMFHTKKVLLAVTFFLVLHLLTDFFVFVIPYLTGYFSPNYFALVYSTPRSSIITLFLNDIAMYNFGRVVFVYLFNLIAISVILLTPFYLWLRLIENKKFLFPRWCLALSFSSLFAYITMPLFSINQIVSSYSGVDLLTRGITKPHLLNIIMIISLSILAIVYLCTRWKHMHVVANFGFILFVMVFAFIYLFNYFISIASYYILSIQNFEDLFIRTVMFLFFIISILFYVAGYTIFFKFALVDHMFKHKKKKK